MFRVVAVGFDTDHSKVASPLTSQCMSPSTVCIVLCAIHCVICRHAPVLVHCLVPKHKLWFPGHQISWVSD